MPIIHVYAFERSLEKKREIAQGITEVTCKAYDVPPEIVTVYIFDVPKENAAHAGVLASEAEGKP
jgi:4-oxalocrotonate tautomerase family enzyme